MYLCVDTYFSFDSIQERDDRPWAAAPDSNQLSHWNARGVPPHALRLKVGAICTLQRNLSVEKGLVHNARVIIKAMGTHTVTVSLLRPNFDPSSNQEYVETEHQITRITFLFKPFNGRMPFHVRRRQFPLRLAYAITFNSCQGLTLDRSVLDGRVEPFAHGQLYTATSRTRCRTASRLYLPDQEERTLANIVYNRLLM